MLISEPEVLFPFFMLSQANHFLTLVQYCGNNLQCSPLFRLQTTACDVSESGSTSLLDGEQKQMLVKGKFMYFSTFPVDFKHLDCMIICT